MPAIVVNRKTTGSVSVDYAAIYHFAITTQTRFTRCRQNSKTVEILTRSHESGIFFAAKFENGVKCDGYASRSHENGTLFEARFENGEI